MLRQGESATVNSEKKFKKFQKPFTQFAEYCTPKLGQDLVLRGRGIHT